MQETPLSSSIRPPFDGLTHHGTTALTEQPSDRAYPGGPWGEALSEICGPLPVLAQAQAFEYQRAMAHSLPDDAAAAAKLARQWYHTLAPSGLEKAMRESDDPLIEHLYQTSANPELVADWVQAFSSHDCWAKEFTGPDRKTSWVHRHFYQLVLVPLVVPAQFAPHALTYSRFMPVRELLTRRTSQWVGERYLLTWMGVAMEYASLCHFRPSSWKNLLQRLRVCLGPLKFEDGWPGLVQFGLPADAPRLWFMVGAMVNMHGWLTQVVPRREHELSVRSDIAKALGFCLDEPAPEVDVGQIALAHLALPAGLCAWLHALDRWQPLHSWTLDPGPRDAVILHLRFASTQEAGALRPAGHGDDSHAGPDSPSGLEKPAVRAIISLRRLQFDRMGWQSLLQTLAQWPHVPDVHEATVWNLVR